MSAESTKNTEMPQEETGTSVLLPSISADDSRQVVIIAASLVLGTSLAAIVLNLVHTEHGKIILSIAIAFVIASMFLAYRGILQPARIVSPSVAFLVLTFFLVDGDGVHDASITAYAAVVVLGGLLLGETGALIFGGLTTLSLFAIVYAEYFGVAALQTTYSGKFDLIDVNTIWFLHLATSAIIYILVRRLSRLVAEAREGEKEFKRANQDLSALRDSLQLQVGNRTESLETQNIELQAASRVANAILVAPDISELLKTSAELIAREFGYDYAGIFLLNEKKDRAILQSVSSESGKKMLEERYELSADEESVVGFVSKNKRPRIVFNQGPDEIFFGNPYLSLMQSEMTLPLISQDEVLGVLDIQTKEPYAFAQSDVAIFQALANQLALTLQNTRLVEEARINLAELELVVAEQSVSVWSKHLEQKSYGFVYSPLGVKPLRTRRLDREERSSGAEADVPITLRGRKIGNINVQRLSRQWTKKEKELLQDVATQIGLAVENARLLYETREQANQEQLVSDVSTKLRETLDIDTVLKTAIEEMKRTFNLREVDIHLTPTDSTES